MVDDLVTSRDLAPAPSVSTEGVLCTMDYVKQLLLTQSGSSSLQFFLYHAVVQMVFSELQNLSPHSQNLKAVPRRPFLPPTPSDQDPEHRCMTTTITHPASGLLLGAGTNSLGELFHFLPNSPQAGVSQCPTTFAMADTYAVVQKRRATSGPGSGSGACSTEGAPLYSHVTPGTRWLQAPREEEAQLGGGELTGWGRGWGGPAPFPSGDHHSWTLCPRQIWPPPGCWSRPEVSQAKPQGLHWVCFSGSHLTYEDVAGGSQASGLGFNLRIGRPKGPRDPPAEWTRV
ncbi:PREDICTED: tyrosine-protein phosphatase non-receptor type 18 [Myotis davidii]|uniref:tyrosine-protein phosphatase non-receptor type 18 n=1 Tax=Myotis davidii TaxID=225400 RepID=UPI000767885E|nr:PREDICTED: tyrosine-protein phosphatase non-receptor type 18 [Myotis davidii]